MTKPATEKKTTLPQKGTVATIFGVKGSKTQRELMNFKIQLEARKAAFGRRNSY